VNLANRDRNRAIVAIITSVTVMAVSLSLSIPLISLTMNKNGIGSDLIGVMGAMPSLAFLFFSPVVPHLTHKFGTGTVLWAALILCSGSIFALGLNDNLIFWFFLRLTMGIAMAALFLISETWINQVAEDSKRGRTVAIYVSFMTLGFALGPVLINFIGTEGNRPFFIAGGIIASASVMFLYSHGTFPKLSGQSHFSVFSFLKLAPMICAAALLVAIFDGSVLTLLPVYGVLSGMPEKTAVLMSSVLLAGNILLQFPIGWIADRIGHYKVILFCGVVGILGALFLPLLIAIPYLLWPMLVIWGGAVVGTYTIALVIMGRLFRGADLITANAAAGILWGAGGLIGPLVGGYAMKVYEPHGMPLFFALVCLLFVLLSIWQVYWKPMKSI
jgi:MFS family permease